MNRPPSILPTAALAAAAALLPSARAQEDEARPDPTLPSQALRDLITQPGAATGPVRGIVEIEASDDEPGRFVEARFLNVTLARLADELGRAADSNVLISQRVSDRRVTLTLRNVDLDGALNAIAISQGLVARHDAESGFHFLATAEEARGDLAQYLSKDTEVFTLLYPNTNDVVRAIGDTFGQRVVVTEDQPFIDQTFQELQNRFRRFDVVEGRSRGLSGTGTNGGGTAVQSFQNNQLGNGGFGSRFFGGLQGQNGQTQRDDFQSTPEPQLTSEQELVLAEAGVGGADAATEAEDIAARRAVTFVTAIQRLNRIVVRSGDPELMEDIRTLIRRLDVPTPLVLLEVRVLRVDLSDGLDSSFDLGFQRGDVQTAFSGGEIVPPAAGSLLPGGSGLDLSNGIFQIVSENFQARLQVLQSKGRVTSLATPVLLTASGEVSRIFSGEQVPIVVGFTEPQVIVGDGATTTLSATPITELRDVGTELLITGNINADRTVTLRLLQETSQVNTDGASILVPSSGTFASQTIDTVQSQSASGTIVAQDGKLLAFGGLIEETTSDQRAQLPVLGDLPLLGFLFRRDASVVQRSELIVLVRPYVMSTAVEGDQISRNWLESLSIHPYRPGDGALSDEIDDWGVFRDSDPAFDRSLFEGFRFHTASSLHAGGSAGGAL